MFQWLAIYNATCLIGGMSYKQISSFWLLLNIVTLFRLFLIIPLLRQLIINLHWIILFFLREAIYQLLMANVVREVVAPSYCCNPLTVATGKKLRLVLDLSRLVNPYVMCVHFKYEDWSVIEQVRQSGCWFFNWVFTSGDFRLSACVYQSNTVQISWFCIPLAYRSAIFLIYAAAVWI